MRGKGAAQRGWKLVERVLLKFCKGKFFTRHILNMLKCSFKDQVVNSSQPIIFQPKSKSDILKEAHKEKEEIAAVKKFQDLVDLYTNEFCLITCLYVTLTWAPCQEISAATLIQDAAHLACGSTGSEQHTAHFCPRVETVKSIFICCLQVDFGCPVTLETDPFLMCDEPEIFHTTGQPSLSLWPKHMCIAADSNSVP